MDPYHFHIEIAEKTAEQLATNAELKDCPAILVPLAAKFMEDERLFSLNKHVKSMGLGTYLVQEHGKSQYGNRVTIVLPDTEGKGGRVECTCSVSARNHLLCQDALAVLKSIDRLDCTRALVDSGHTLASYRALHSHLDYPVVLPIWSELSKGDLLPPRQVTRQAGAPKNRGPRQRSRIPGPNDNCQGGRGNVAQDGGGRGGGRAAGGGGGRGGGGNFQPVPVHGRAVFAATWETSTSEVPQASDLPQGCGGGLRLSVTAHKTLPVATTQQGRGPGQALPLVNPNAPST
ncbi:unnamed protein product, partial [Ectocarpus sp. 4 AP-2014]